MAHIPSLSNPPNAPDKKKAAPRRNLGEIRRLQFEEEEQVSWRWLVERGVCAKFLRYNPEDIKEIDDIDTLCDIKDLYMPSSQPHNIYEHSYCQLMVDAVDEKLYIL